LAERLPKFIRTSLARVAKQHGVYRPVPESVTAGGPSPVSDMPDVYAAVDVHPHVPGRRVR